MKKILLQKRILSILLAGFMLSGFVPTHSSPINTKTTSISIGIPATPTYKTENLSKTPSVILRRSENIEIVEHTELYFLEEFQLNIKDPGYKTEQKTKNKVNTRTNTRADDKLIEKTYSKNNVKFNHKTYIRTHIKANARSNC